MAVAENKQGRGLNGVELIKLKAICTTCYKITTTEVKQKSRYLTGIIPKDVPGRCSNCGNIIVLKEY